MLKEKLRNVRKTKRLTQAQVAKVLNISQQAYAQYENGKAMPDIEALKKIASLFNVSLNYLLEEQEKPFDEENYIIKGRGGGEISITKEQQEVINTLIDSFIKSNNSEEI